MFIAHCVIDLRALSALLYPHLKDDLLYLIANHASFNHQMVLFSPLVMSTFFFSLTNFCTPLCHSLPCQDRSFLCPMCTYADLLHYNFKKSQLIQNNSDYYGKNKYIVPVHFPFSEKFRHSLLRLTSLYRPPFLLICFISEPLPLVSRSSTFPYDY